MSTGKSTSNSTTNTSAATTMEDDPWQTAAQVAASRNQRDNTNTNEPSSWSERPPWLSSKTSQQQQQQHSVTWNALERSQPQQRTGVVPGVTHDDTAWTRHVVQGWHVVDGIAGLLWLLYALLLCQAHHHHQKEKDPTLTPAGWHVLMILTWYVAGVLLVRTLMGGIAMTLDWWDRCGLRWSSYTSILLGITWMIAALYGFFGKKRILNWLQVHYPTLLWSSEIWHLVQHTPVLLWIVPLVACVLELIRCFMVQRYYLLLLEQGEDIRHSNAAVQRPRRTRRPWWWQSNSATSMDPTNHNTASHMDPLLTTAGTTAAEARTSRSTGWFGGWFGGNGGGDAGRDDGSVEYASISEDWASRSEEDPLWWSRDEQEMRTPQRNS